MPSASSKRSSRRATGNGAYKAARAKSFFQNLAPRVSPATARRRRAPDDAAPLRAARSCGGAVERNTQGSGASGKGFWEVGEFERIPGVGPIAAHVFSAIIEEPGRFHTKHQLWKYSQLGITDRTSDGKPLGYQRLDRRGNHELKNLSYHAWRTACKSTTGPNPIKSLLPAEPASHWQCPPRRLNTQRKILETMWLMWLRQKPFDPARFALKTDSSSV